MAVHDVDTTSDNRTSASPLHHDVSSARKADGTQGVTQKVNDDTGPYVRTKDGQIVVYDTNNRAVIVMGIVPQYSDEPLFIVAKDGYDVFTDILEV